MSWISLHPEKTQDQQSCVATGRAGLPCGTTAFLLILEQLPPACCVFVSRDETYETHSFRHSCSTFVQCFYILRDVIQRPGSTCDSSGGERFGSAHSAHGHHFEDWLPAVSVHVSRARWRAIVSGGTGHHWRNLDSEPQSQFQRSPMAGDVLARILPQR